MVENGWSGARAGREGIVTQGNCKYNAGEGRGEGLTKEWKVRGGWHWRDQSMVRVQVGGGGKREGGKEGRTTSQSDIGRRVRMLRRGKSNNNDMKMKDSETELLPRSDPRQTAREEAAGIHSAASINGVVFSFT